LTHCDFDLNEEVEDEDVDDRYLLEIIQEMKCPALENVKFD
jgi:hypothetical protein